MTKQVEQKRGWYAVHTYSGYEEIVAEDLKQRAVTLHLTDSIFDIMVPKEKQIEIKNSKRKTVERRIFPGYVLVEMIVTDDTWYVVRNTPYVTGFVGEGTTPIPMSDKEIRSIQKRIGIDDPKFKIDFSIGDVVSISDGPFKGFDGAVSEIDEAKGKIKVLVTLFGRETSVELDGMQVKKL